MSGSSEIKHFYEAEDKYFNVGGELTTTYVDNADVDFSELAFQNQIHRLNKAMQECEGCLQKWHQGQSLSSWYDDFSSWVSYGNCPLISPYIVPGQAIVLPQEQFY